MLALDATTGKILWKAPTGDTTPAPANQGGNGPRCTPACDGTLVYGITQSGTIVCIQAASGKEVWRKNMKEFGGSEPGWGYSESPLLDGQVLVCTPGGGKGSVVGLNKMNGALMWQCAGIKDPPHYTSVVMAEINKIPQYVVLTISCVAGIAKTGQLLWKSEFPGKTAICSSPVVKDNFVFASCGYGVGCKGLQITGAGAQFKAQEVYSDAQIQNHHGGAILVNDHIYGQFDNGLACVDIKTGKVAWRGGPGKGSLAVADGHLYCRTERGDVSLAEVSTEGYKEKGKFSLPSATKIPSWANPVVFGGKLYLRDEDTLYCYDVKAK
jgi:outer membrane protein assembly factor BamB